jgi:hypothetical protein
MLKSSRIPGVAIANAWNRRLEPSAWPTGPVLTRRYSSVGELDLLEGLAALVERLPDPVLAGQLGDDRAQAAARRHHPERDRHRRLADAALAGDEDQPPLEKSGHDRAT